MIGVIMGLIMRANIMSLEMTAYVTWKEVSDDDLEGGSESDAEGECENIDRDLKGDGEDDGVFDGDDKEDFEAGERMMRSTWLDSF
jgi:nucleosome binding factor SPN SPT16 subunit